MRRRPFLFATGALLAPAFGAEAQQRARIARIGLLGDRRATGPRLDALLQGLRDLEYVEGRNLSIEHRYAEGKPERYPALAAELVALKVDVVVSGNTLGSLAVKQATATVPIVFIGAADPVRSGLVASLARPEGNATGLSALSPELIGKSLELLTQAVPKVARVAVLWEPGSQGERTDRDMLKEADVAARTLGIRLQVVGARGTGDLDRCFSEMTRDRAEALVVIGSARLNNERQRMVDLAARNRLPAIYFDRTSVDAGGLLSYGPNIPDLWRRAATYVDKIVKGARPADLPVEQPTKFELIINLKTAKALGITIPPSFLRRADEVIT